MKCNKIQSRLSAFLDDELNEQEQQAIQQHVDFCKNCQAILAQFQKVNTILDDGVRLQADPFLITRIKTGAKESYSPLRWVRVAMQKTLVPATVVAGLLVGVLIGIQLNTLSVPQKAMSAAVAETEEPTSKYSVLDPNIYEPMPSSSITATYVSANSTR